MESIEFGGRDMPKDRDARDKSGGGNQHTPTLTLTRGQCLRVTLSQEARTLSGECKVLNLFEGLIFLLACSVHLSTDDSEKWLKSSADKMHK